MILFTQITVPMTDFKVDVFIGGTKEENQLVQINRYGFSKEEVDDITENECASITSGENGIIKPQKTFLLHLEKMPIDNLPVFIHEIWHLMFHISETITDFKINNNTQTWGACMIESIAKDILNAKYEELILVSE
jgi:hypothetical protein